MVVGYELVGVSCGWWWDAAGWYHGLLGFVFFFGIYGRRWFSVVVTVSGMGGFVVEVCGFRWGYWFAIGFLDLGLDAIMVWLGFMAGGGSSRSEVR